MKIKTAMIDGAANLLLDGQLWKDVKKLVSDMNNTKLPNDVRHDRVFADLRTLFGNIGDNILNLAISLAVTWAKAQQAK